MTVYRLVLLMSLTSFSTWANTVEPSQFVFCRHDKIIRTIRIENDTEGCRTTYTKAGIDRIVGTAKNHSSCESVLNGVRTNLEKGDWQCRAISKAAVSIPAAESTPENPGSTQ